MRGFLLSCQALPSPEVLGLSVSAVRLIKWLATGVVRRVSRGHNSPSINSESLIMLFNDFVFLCRRQSLG